MDRCVVMAPYAARGRLWDGPLAICLKGRVRKICRERYAGGIGLHVRVGIRGAFERAGPLSTDEHVICPDCALQDALECRIQLGRLVSHGDDARNLTLDLERLS